MKLARPSVRRLVGLSVVALALAGGALGAVAVESVFRGLGSILAATFVCTTLLFGAALVISLRSSESVYSRTLIASTLLGGLNGPAVLILAGWLGGPRAGDYLSPAICVGPLVGIPLGALYGAVALVGTRRLRNLLDRPTLTAHLAAQETVGATVFGAALVGLIAALQFETTQTVWLPPILLALGAALAGQAFFREVRVRRFAANPKDPNYERVALSSLGLDRAALLPLDEDVSPNASHVLVSLRAPTGDGAYRAVVERIPLALVD